LIDAPVVEQVAAERAKIVNARLGCLKRLSQVTLDGTWAGTAWEPGLESTMHVLSPLREMGLGSRDS